MERLSETVRLGQTQNEGQLTTEQHIPMSDLEFEQRFDENSHAEWADGTAILFMSPTTRHQRIVNFLQVLIGLFLQAFGYGELFEAPYAMRISSTGSIREPDLLVVLAENASRIGEKRLEGPADLVIEVISPESAARDRSDKFDEYQLGGVREYWVIDPRPGLMRVDFWVLDDNGKYQPARVGPDGIYHSMVLPNFSLDVNMILADNLPLSAKVAAKLIGREAMMRLMGLASEDE